MLSYMIPPVETNNTTTTNTTTLVLNLNNNEIIDSNKTSMMDSERQRNSDFITSEKLNSSVIEQCDLDEKINIVNEKLQHQKMMVTTTITDTNTSSVIVSDKTKLTKLNLKNAPLKRVSFGSNKEGSMVETVIYETPTPLPETAEKQFFSSDYTNGNSFNELQEELERSKVRVSFFQSIKPQQISPPADFEFHCFSNPLLDNLFINPADIGNNNMTAALMPDYQRNLSSIDDGTENPFRPDGELSKEADEIVNLIKGGNLTTPINENYPQIIDEKDGGAVVVKEAKKLDASSPMNGSKNHQNENSNGEAIAETNQVANQTVPGPQSATSVVIDEKKKKKSSCCVIQ